MKFIKRKRKRIEKKELIFLLVLLLVSIYLQFSHNNLFIFYDEMERDLFILENISKDQLLVEGPPAIVVFKDEKIEYLTGLGPLYYYLLIVPYKFFKTPIALFFFIKLFHIFAIFLCYKIGKEFFNMFIAMLSSLFFAISPIINFGFAKLLYFSFIPFFSLLFLYSLFKILLHNQRKYLIIAVISFAFLIQFSLVTFVFMFVLIILFILFKVKISPRYYLLSIMFFLLLFLPFILIESNNNFKTTKSYIDLALMPIFGQDLDQELYTDNEPNRFLSLILNFDLLLNQIEKTRFLSMGLLYDFIRTINNSYPKINLIILITDFFIKIQTLLFLFGFIYLCMMIIKIKKEKENKRKRLRKYYVLILWIIIPITTLFFTIPNYIESRHFYLLHPIEFIITSIFLYHLFKKFKTRKIILSILVIFLVFIILSQILFSFYLFKVIGSGLATKNKVPLFTFKDQKDIFSLLNDFDINSEIYYNRFHNIRIKENFFGYEYFSYFKNKPYLNLSQNNYHYLIIDTEKLNYISFKNKKLKKNKLFSILEYNPLIDYSSFRFSETYYKNWNYVLFDDSNWNKINIPYTSIFDPALRNTLYFRNIIDVEDNNTNFTLIISSFHVLPFNDSYLDLFINGELKNLKSIEYESFHIPIEYHIESSIDLKNMGAGKHLIAVKCINCYGFDIFEIN